MCLQPLASQAGSPGRGSASSPSHPDVAESVPGSFSGSGPGAAGQGHAEEQLLAVFEQLRGRLLSALRSVLGSADDAEDVLQSTFVKCWEARETVPHVRDLSAWVWQIAWNQQRDLVRLAWRRRARPLDALPSVPGDERACPANAAADREERRRLAAALTYLRAEYREVFLLRQGEATYEEIASRLNRPVGTIKTQMRAALQQLRQRLQEATPGSQTAGPAEVSGTAA